VGKNKRMDQIKTIVKIYQDCGSIKETSRILKVSKNTIKKYLRAISFHKIDLSKALELSDDALNDIVLKDSSLVEQERFNHFERQVDYWINELRRTGVTRHLLWQEYLTRYPNGYAYSQFCEHLRKRIGAKDLTLPMEHKPGEVLQLDFAGKHLHWVDIKSGECISCEILIGVFPHSQYTYAIALPSQQIQDFIYGINQAFLFFEGLPKVILSDNLKSYVTRADRYQPKFTQLCEQLGAHFKVDLQATRPRKPKDKASVENAVRIAYTRIYAPLRDQIFLSIEELNAAIVKQLAIHNNKTYQKKIGTRLSVFKQYELPLMRTLPNQLFEIKKTVKAKVQRNYHIMLGEDKDFYSVPFQYVGSSSQVVYTTKTVSVFIGNQRVAFHDRLLNNGYRYQTKKEHMPDKHQKWKEIKGYDAQHFISESIKIGPATHWAIERVLLSRIHEEQTYNSCLGIFQLAKKYGEQRLENAASRCINVDKVNYSILKRILEKNLDIATEQETEKPLPKHENIRGSKNYN